MQRKQLQFRSNKPSIKGVTVTTSIEGVVANMNIKQEVEHSKILIGTIARVKTDKIC